MSANDDISRVVRSWIRADEPDSADHILQVVLGRLDATPQRRSWWPARRFAVMNGYTKFAAATIAVVVAVAMAGITFLPGTGGPGDTPPGPSPSQASPVPTRVPKPSNALPPRHLPDMSLINPAGGYGWEGSLGQRGGMHRVTDIGQVASMFFGVEADCFARGQGPDPVPVTVAGFSGTYVEPYGEPEPLSYSRAKESATTRGYALDVGARTLCVYVTWYASTPPAELAATLAILDSLRAEESGVDGIRVNFTLPAGWDTG